MSTQGPALSSSTSAGGSVVAGSLRAAMEARRAQGKTFDIREIVGIGVPLCVRLAELHASGKRLFVYPSVIRYDGPEVEIDEARTHVPPTLPRDRACLAPEERKGNPGDAAGSVFAVGAIMYELLTNAAVGPGMRRPAELVADLPASLEVILGKALVADPKHRPHDLHALAQALHHVAPSASIAPPPADESHLDHEEGFDVDVSLSLIPPPPKMDAGPALPKAPAVPRIDGAGPYPIAVVAAPTQAPRNDPTQRLADMKAALESDPRPRYVVVKDGMDHGPFSAVELLQQIAQHVFLSDHALRDVFTNDERFIKEWEEFAPFAEQAKLNQDIKIEKQAFEATVQKEKEGAQYKTLIGVAIIGVVLAGGLGFWLKNRADKEKALQIAGQTADVVNVDGGIGAGSKPGGPGGGGRSFGGPSPGGGSYPVLAGGTSCEGAAAKYSEEYKIGGNNGPPDLTAGAYGAVLNKGTYLNSCGVPPSMAVNVCAAVQNGRAVGVTVTTDPPNPGISSCIAGQVRSMGFPSHPRLDVTRTSFAAQ
ncbi:MAG: hypothetical protein IPK82_17795 [Polyangiaceae bacterium]|nr:hypothetical protein [Polyangiaceae bacterium]